MAKNKKADEAEVTQTLEAPQVEESAALPVDETVVDWTRDTVKLVAYAIGVPTGNAKTILGDMSAEESAQVRTICAECADRDEAIRLVRGIVQAFQQRKAKPKVEKGAEPEATE